MRKRNFLLSLLLAFTIHLFATEVPESISRQIAVNYMNKHLPAQQKASKMISSEIKFLHKPTGKTAFNIFGFSDGGFVLVAADDNVYPILGFSGTELLDTSNIAPALRVWLNNYAEQISYAANLNYRTPSVEAAWNRLKTNSPDLKNNKSVQVGPLLLTTWDQGNFYNGLCPEDLAGPGGRVYAGCVATAMAQVMKYYNYPPQGSGSHGYNDWDYGYLDADFGSTIYRWTHMPNSLNNHNQAVAELLYHCGVAVEMGYSPDGSGAYSEDVVPALKNFFGYSNSLNIKQRDDYTDQQWVSMLKTNLDGLMPMYYSGYSDEGGHAFNFDGYTDDGSATHFHINWGWSGYGNGFFYINNLASPGGNFDYWHQAIFNIIPAQNYPVHCSGTNTIDGTSGTFEDGSGMYNYQSNTSCSWLIDPAVNVVNIKLSFDRIDTESGQDIISVYDGDNTSAPLLGSFSGNTVPQQLVSTGKKMLVTFSSNSSVNSAGWAASYTTTKPVYCDVFSIITDPSGTISDGSGSYNYNAGTNCRWKIAPQGTASISISFNDFDIYSGSDVFEVYDVSAQPYSLLDSYTGNVLPQTKTYYASAILLWFKSQGAPRTGWELSYTTTPASIDEINTSSVRVFPNPARNVLNIVTENINDEMSLKIFDSRGKNILNLNKVHCPLHLDISEWADGLYHINLISNNRTESLRILKL